MISVEAAFQYLSSSRFNIKIEQIIEDILQQRPTSVKPYPISVQYFLSLMLELVDFLPKLVMFTLCNVTFLFGCEF